MVFDLFIHQVSLMTDALVRLVRLCASPPVGLGSIPLSSHIEHFKTGIITCLLDTHHD